MSIPPPSGPHQPQHPHRQPPGPWGQGPGPYGPYLYGSNGTYGAPPPVNGVSIAALVLGLLCFLPAAGLVLGLIALRQIRRKGERGRGMAIAGSVLSSAGLALWVVSLSTGVVADAWDGLRDAVRGNESLTLRKGECFDSPGGMEGDTYDVDRVPCGGAHDGEVFAVVKLSDGRFPGDRSVADTADERCYALQDTYAMDTWAVPKEAEVYYLLPSRETWTLGDRAITCVFGNANESGHLTGSLREDGTTLDGDQVAYLKAERVQNAALESAPDTEYVEDDLGGHRAWAGRVSAALAEQTRMLRGHRWPAGAERPVSDLAAGLDKARQEWARAAKSPDVDTFYEHYDKAYDLITPQRSVTARKALGLATTPPAYEESGESGGGDSGAEV
ncbi:DUF4190 domain-containing protein [Streptomyces sp. TRM68367]|uniref:DUF4190 domain-containing protein n=1 Tax=Streptomyces sp. TRM68367 TaxID=2758415 RepID=UPI002935246E|nr:DUF4190 domain-containing protein [Streptomyces sp. TRM68367]